MAIELSPSLHGGEDGVEHAGDGQDEHALRESHLCALPRRVEHNADRVEDDHLRRPRHEVADAAHHVLAPVPPRDVAAVGEAESPVRA